MQLVITKSELKTPSNVLYTTINDDWRSGRYIMREGWLVVGRLGPKGCCSPRFYKDMPGYQQNFMKRGELEVEWFFGFGLVGVGSMRLSTGEWDLWYPFKMIPPQNDTPLIVDILCFEQATEKWTKIKYDYDQSGALSHIIICIWVNISLQTKPSYHPTSIAPPVLITCHVLKSDSGQHSQFLRCF